MGTLKTVARIALGTAATVVGVAAIREFQRSGNPETLILGAGALGIGAGAFISEAKEITCACEERGTVEYSERLALPGRR